MAETVLAFIVSYGGSILADFGLKTIWRKISSPLGQARKAAVKRMANELRDDFASVNFLEMNFKFDSPAMKAELSKLRTDREAPDEGILKKEIAQELIDQWPYLADKAEKIVETFLSCFEEECLTRVGAQGLALTAILRQGFDVTRQVVQVEGEKTRELIAAQNAGIKELNRKFDLFADHSVLQEKPLKTKNALERRLAVERDDIQSLFLKWQTAGLEERIRKLAEEVYGIRDEIGHQISGSIFRIYGSFILRFKGNLEKARKWIELANIVDPDNHKSIALKAELKCYEKDWTGAKKILESIAEESTEPLVKIVYAECLSRTESFVSALEWLESQEDTRDNNQVKLNIANLAVNIGRYDYALKILEELECQDYPGPYAYLLHAQALVSKAGSPGRLSFGPHEDMELLQDKESLSIAIEKLEKGIELLKCTSKPFEEIKFSTFSLVKLYLATGDATKAAALLRQYWKINLRNDNIAWSLASSIASLNGKNGKAINRAQKALSLTGKDDYENMLGLATLYINIGEWGLCLKVMESIQTDICDSSFQKALLQMKLICFLGNGSDKSAEEIITAFKRKFPNDESWVIIKSLNIESNLGAPNAISFLESEQKNYTRSFSIKLRLAFLCRLVKDYPKSFSLYKELTFISKNIQILERACSLVLYSSDLNDDVLATIAEAQKLGLTSQKLLYYKAIVLTMEDKFDLAYDLFESLPESIFDNNGYVYFAFCCAKKGLADRAIALLESAKSKFNFDCRIVQGLCSLYQEAARPEDAFREACDWLECNPDDKASYITVMMIGYSIGESKRAHETMLQYLARFGEGPELRSVKIEEVKELQKAFKNRSEFLWEKYQAGHIPEVALTRNINMPIGSGRVMLINSNDSIMAFDGSSAAQKRQYLDTSTSSGVVIDYYALISIHLLDLYEPILQLFGTIIIPLAVSDEIRADLAQLSTAYQKDRRRIEEKAFSTVKNSFTVIKEFPQLSQDERQGALGNIVLDLVKCKELNSAYITPGFDQDSLSEAKLFWKDINVFSVLDLIDLLKDKGKITVIKYDEIIEKLSVHSLKRLNESKSIPGRIMVDWSALLLLEECGALEYVPSLFEECYVGPFSNAILESEIAKYTSHDDVVKILDSLNTRVRALISEEKASIVLPSTQIQEDDELKHIAGLEYVKDIKSVLSIKPASVLCVDDLIINRLLAADGLKTTCTRTIIDVLLDKGFITKTEFLQCVLKIIGWKMHFCWVNSSILFACAEMYDFSMSDDLKAILNQLGSEIQKFENKIPNADELSNFNVLFDFIRDLWITSTKAQALSGEVFDFVRTIVKDKDTLGKLWISKCIMGFAFLDIIVLEDFLKALSLRVVSTFRDELSPAILLALEAMLKSGSDSISHISYSRNTVVKLIKAVRRTLPDLESKCVARATELDPTIKTLL